jgi:amino acid adenylation domain-containing protein
MQIEDRYPLSPMQQGMLFHSQYAPQSGVYVQQLICTLQERLNVSAFKRAWDRVVERHPVFRTSFRWKGLAQPVQEVHRQVKIPVEEQDLRGIPSTQQEERLHAYLDADRRRGFDLAEAPLMRLALFYCSQAKYQLVWTSHHAVLDGRSRLLVLKELFAFYEAFCSGRHLVLDRPPPYRNYIDWLGNKEFAEAEGFWRTTLRGLAAPTILPLDQGRYAKASVGNFGEQTTGLCDRITSDLKSRAEKHQLTPNTFLQGAWALLLSRYAGETDVVFGATRAGRHAGGIQGADSIVGLLINTVPVCVSTNSDRLLLPWLKQLHTQWISMRDFEHIPLVNIQGWSHIPGGRPLFESLLVFENYQLNEFLCEQSEDWKNREFHLHGTTHYPLTVAGYLGRELCVEITYDRERFGDETIARMLHHLGTLLTEMVCNPDRRLADLPLLSAAERHQVLIQWNDTKRDCPTDKLVHELFEEQVERSPDAVAVMFEDQPLTYRQLNSRANQLAHHLQTLGVGPEVMVSICLERSLDMVVSVLGILKAGGAYVPLDPSYPKERLALMLEDTGINVLLTQQRLVEPLPEHNVSIVRIDTEWEIIAQESEVGLTGSVQPENLAYMIYTSGSTGKPKGVQVPHGAVVNFLNSMRRRPGLTERDILVAVTRLSFDIAGLELLLPLIVGGRVVLVGPHVAADGTELAAVLETSGATVMQATPSTWRMLLEADWHPRNPFNVLCGGETLPHDLADALLNKASSVWNMYGPTETTIWSATRRIESGQSVIPLGCPIDNTQIYVLDQYLNPAPIGAPGELYIGGVGLARGYKNHPELAAEKFIPNPISAKPGARLYKTGDLARYLPDGNIEFLGRTDHQVKIRGFRIELGEIEAVLAQHPAVREAVVQAREESENQKSKIENLRSDKRLVAYVVSREGTSPTVNELRSFIKEKLPEYMIPSVFVFLDSLPLTANRKVDRKALPEPNQARPDLEATFVSPRTPAEDVVAQIWSEVLAVKHVGIHDNFFDLGGHSLLAMQLIWRLRKAFDVEMPLRILFENPTVAEFALKAAEAQAKKIAPRNAEDVLADLESLTDEQAEHFIAQRSHKLI